MSVSDNGKLLALGYDTVRFRYQKWSGLHFTVNLNPLMQPEEIVSELV